MSGDPSIGSVTSSVYRVPTDEPESDGTLMWDHTDVVVVQVKGGDLVGLGWTYATPAAADLIDGPLAQEVVGKPATATAMVWAAMVQKLRNAGVSGVGSMAVAAVDIALWDLKAKLLETSLVALLGEARDAVPIYGSGGFTSYTEERLLEQLGGWANQGIPRVKMKVGRFTEADVRRVTKARAVIGAETRLFVDANGAYARKQALAMAEAFAERGEVSWFEEPCSSDDLDGLRLLRDRAPAGMDVASGEYGDKLVYFRHMLAAGAVDCLQVDVTRCGGYTGFLKAAALAEAFG